MMQLGNETYNEAVQGLYNAMSGSDEAQQKEAFENFGEVLAENLKEKALAEVETKMNTRTDNEIMKNRTGRMQLTSEEQAFFNEAVTKQTIEGLEEVFPTTIIETVLTDIAEEHPIISVVDTRYTEAAIKYIYADHAEKTAYWDVIPADIRQILVGTFKTLDMTASKLSGFIALPKGYFQLGPAWLANYVISYLHEAISASLETAIVNGDGNHKPLGMMRNLSGAVDNVYPEKTAVSITDLTPMTLAGPRALLANEKQLNGQISFIVNPVTFETKINPLLFFQNTTTGEWTRTALPNGENVVTSYAVPEDKAIIGNTKNYLLAVAGNTQISTHPDTLAIEDMDLYIAKFFGAGAPKNPNAFVVLDLAGIEGATVPTAEADAEYVAQDNVTPVNPTDSQALDEDGNTKEQLPGA